MANSSLVNATEDQWSQNKQKFLEVCNNSRCDNATLWIGQAMLGKDEKYRCNFYDITYEGFTFGGFFKGWSDIIMARGSYLVALESLGVVIESAYQTLQNPDLIIYVNATTD